MRDSFAKLMTIVIVLSSLAGCKSGGSWNMFAKNETEAPLYNPGKSSGVTLPSQKALAAKNDNRVNQNQNSVANSNATGTNDKYKTGNYASKQTNFNSSKTRGTSAISNVYTKQSVNPESLVQQGQYDPKYTGNNNTASHYSKPSVNHSTVGRSFAPSYSPKKSTPNNVTSIDNSYVNRRSSATNYQPVTSHNPKSTSRSEQTSSTLDQKLNTLNAGYQSTGNYAKQKSTGDNRYRSEQVQQPSTNQRFTPPTDIAAGTRPTSNPPAKPWRPGGTGNFKTIAPGGIPHWAKNPSQAKSTATIPRNTPQDNYTGAKSYSNTTSQQPIANTITPNQQNNQYYQKTRTATQDNRYPSTETPPFR